MLLSLLGVPTSKVLEMSATLMPISGWGTVNAFILCLSLPFVKKKYDSDHLCKQLGILLMKASHQNYFIMVKMLRFVLMAQP